jgi:PAS domain S-box-containing protein
MRTMFDLSRAKVSPKVAYGVAVFFSLAAWIFAFNPQPDPQPRAALIFLTAASLSAILGGLLPGLLAAAIGSLGLHYFLTSHLHALPSLRNEVIWISACMVSVLVFGYLTDRRRAAEARSGVLSSDVAALREELALQRSDLTRFHDLSVRLSSSLDLKSLLNEIMTAVTSLQKTELGLVLLLEPDSSNQLYVETQVGFTPEQLELFQPCNSSFFSTRRHVLIEDVLAPGTSFPFMQAAVAIGFRGVFSTPMLSAKGETLGIILTFFREPHQPSERDLKLVDLYARQAANSIENAQIYRLSLETVQVEKRRATLLRSLADASLRINSALSLDSLLRVITEQAREIIGAHQAFTTIAPRGSWAQSLSCVSLSPLYQERGAVGPERSELFFLACNLNKPLRVTADSQAGTPWWFAVSGVPAKTTDNPAPGWLAAPLITGDGRNLGVIQLSHKIEGEFTEEDESILMQLAHMASVAVDNVRLYREAQEQIAERARAQDALQRSKESLHLAQRSVRIGMWEWDLQAGTLNWSDEICALHGMDPGQFGGKYETWMETIHPEDRERVHRAVAHALANNSEYEVQYRLANPVSGVEWLEARGQAFGAAGTPVRLLGVAMDITSRKLSEETLRTTEKLAATGRLAASIAHEINNPLAAVTNLLYLLRLQPLDKTAREYVKNAEAELARVVHITRQTLAFYRESAVPAETDLPKLIDEVLSIYSTQMETADIKVAKEYRFDGQLLAFSSELRQVFSNLIVNAIEASSRQGRLRIRVREAADDAGVRGVRLTVADNGAGILPRHRSHIFEPFFTTKGEKGTGLGLWVTQGIVHKHGGTIRVRSSVHREAHGTCISLFLPLKPTQRSQRRELTEWTGIQVPVESGAHPFSGAGHAGA